ncbi:high-potential iron-sulfur protein [Rheinheimera salexigens]|uniref:High-potential iron-sulfur protein n=1 Tax=Rheinheimera salexigens TaxID=1628148 RepID=A0A1E7Q5H6_9GAMM|nr:high-potential iron-sulfur protein [Rheinheimera salexigens]OEY69432.1 high-potential iron sulfur protein 2 [Rheinheimera salexigens]
MKTNRRRFLKLSAGGLVGLSVGGVSLKAFANEQLDAENPQAKALQYTHQSEKEDANCANCALIQGTEGEEWRPCAIFPGKLVHSDGWCAAWAQKPA